MVDSPVPPLGDGQVLVRHHYLSLDPYMRGRMSEAKSYAAPQPLNEVMIGGTVGDMVESRSPRVAAGDRVVGMGGWQEYSIVDAAGPSILRKVDTSHIPLTAYLGAVGMPGVTAWYGVMKIITPKPGGAEKCRYVTDELGFDACIDYKVHRNLGALTKALKAACPNGVDGHFENVGGVILDAVMLRANAFARVTICGMIAGYNGEPIPMQYPQLILNNRMTLEGFIVSEYMEVWPEALQELGMLVATGRLKYRETIAEGLESAPEAFFGLLKERNFGKQLVKLA